MSQDAHAQLAALRDPHSRITVSLSAPFDTQAVTAALSAFEAVPPGAAERVRRIWAGPGGPVSVCLKLPSGRYIGMHFVE